MTTQKIPVTVVVPVKNEEANLKRCLSCLSDFEEVVVIDSGSTDATCDIAREYTATHIDFKWNGRYPKKRNWYLENFRPKCAWVFFVDADEYIDEKVCFEIRVKTQDSAFEGYWLNYTNYFMDEKLRHGVPQKKLALFRFGETRYEKVEVTPGDCFDMEVHEHPIITGRVGEILSPIEHKDYKGIKAFLEKHLNYAQWETARYLAVEEFGIERSIYTRRQLLKYNNLGKWWFSEAFFIYSYFIKFGFLDGYPGFCYARYKAWYLRTIRQLIKEAYRDKRRSI